MSDHTPDVQQHGSILQTAGIPVTHWKHWDHCNTTTVLDDWAAEILYQAPMGKPLPSKKLSVFRISSLFIFIESLVVPFCLANILTPNAVLRPWLCSRDYSKRRDYYGIKKALEEKGIRLQTSYTNKRIDCDNGIRTYSNAHEAGLELKRRSFSVVVSAPREEDSSAATRLKELLKWQRLEKSQKEGRSTAAGRAKEKLWIFKRSTPEWLQEQVWEQQGVRCKFASDAYSWEQLSKLRALDT